MKRREPLAQDREPIVLTVQQAAKLLQVSANHVYSLVSQGAIPHTRFGKLIRIPRWGLLQFIAASSGAPAPTFFEVDSPANESVHALQRDSEEDSDGQR